jgi:hypothetical protein
MARAVSMMPAVVGWVLAGLLVSTGGGGIPRVEAAVSVNVPLDHPAYEWVERLAASGAADTAFLGARPWSRDELARLVEEAVARRAALDPVSLILVARLEREFRPELDDRKSDGGSTYFKPAERLALRGFATSGNAEALGQHGDVLGDGFDARLDWQAHARLGHTLGFALRPELRYGTGDSIPLRRHGLNQEPPPVDETGARVDLRESYVKLRLWNLELEGGRDHLWWGPGRRGALLLSDNAEPLDLIKLSNPDPIELPWFLGYLGPFQFEWFWTELEHARAVPRAQLSGLRFDFKPTPNVEIGLARVVQFGGYARPGLFDTGVADVLTGFNDSGENDTENSIAAVNLAYRLRWPVRGSVYLDWGGEDQSKLLDVVPFFHDHGWVVGVYLPGVVPGVPVDLRFEWFKSDATRNNPHVFYNHSTYQSGYTYRGKILGHPFGSAAEAYSLRVDYFAGDSLQVGADVDWVTNEVVGVPNDEQDLRLGCDAALFTHGVAQYSLRYDLESRSDVDGVSGDDATNHRLMVEMALDL